MTVHQSDGQYVISQLSLNFNLQGTSSARTRVDSGLKMFELVEAGFDSRCGAGRARLGEV